MSPDDTIVSFYNTAKNFVDENKNDPRLEYIINNYIYYIEEAGHVISECTYNIAAENRCLNILKCLHEE